MPGLVYFVEIPSSPWGRWFGFYSGGRHTSTLYFSALSNAIKMKHGQVSKIYDFLPVKVMSYVMLPCTLPMESAIAMAQR